MSDLNLIENQLKVFLYTEAYVGDKWVCINPCFDTVIL